jgi:hypothetical protein
MPLSYTQWIKQKPRKIQRKHEDAFKIMLIDFAKGTNRFATGVAQGSPCSPFIFALCVDNYFFKHIAKGTIKCLAYADDALFYGDIHSEKEILKDSPKQGFIINREKSG